MPKLPRIKPKEAIRALKRAGFSADHISGSHYIMYHNDNTPPISIPFHNRDLKLGTLKSILRQAKISVSEFLELL